MFAPIGDSLLVYPSSVAKDASESRDELVRVIAVNDAAHDLLLGNVDAETFADIAEANGVQMDDFLDCMCEDFEYFGLIE